MTCIHCPFYSKEWKEERFGQTQYNCGIGIALNIYSLDIPRECPFYDNTRNTVTVSKDAHGHFSWEVD